MLYAVFNTKTRTHRCVWNCINRKSKYTICIEPWPYRPISLLEAYFAFTLGSNLPLIIRLARQQRSAEQVTKRYFTEAAVCGQTLVCGPASKCLGQWPASWHVTLTPGGPLPWSVPRPSRRHDTPADSAHGLDIDRTNVGHLPASRNYRCLMESTL